MVVVYLYLYYITRFNLSVENEQAGAGRDGRTRFARPNSPAYCKRGQGYVDFPCSADHEQDWQPYPVDLYSTICDEHLYIANYYFTKYCTA